ncbi:MAG: DNA/RNA non-specific endonuclease [Eubacterium sp.]|nr:DNA/RNA non-specific endonuclease [Eubacterium sp.]
MKKHTSLSIILLIVCVMLTACSASPKSSISASVFSKNESGTTSSVSSVKTIDTVGEYSGKEYTEINGNKPNFDKSEITTESFEEYGNLDYLGRCTVCTACVGKDLMPTEKRGAIGSVKPTGWHLIKYDSVDGGYLYNRCHLIAYMLTAENANSRNLITGTRYMNTAMIPFETQVCDYVKSTNNHVMYRVTPLFKDEELVARGVQMEAYSVEDNGKGVCFNVYLYNIQPNIEIDYKTGDSHLSDTPTASSSEAASGAYILNTNSKKFHKPSCSGASSISKKNKKAFEGSRDELIKQGYSPCKSCNP